VTKERRIRRARRLARRTLNRLHAAFRFIQRERFARALIAVVDLAVTVYQGAVALLA